MGKMVSGEAFICNVCLKCKPDNECATAWNVPELGGIVYVCKDCQAVRDEKYAEQMDDKS